MKSLIEQHLHNKMVKATVKATVKAMTVTTVIAMGCLSTVGCTTFQGAGPYQSQETQAHIEEAAPAAAPMGPTLSWSGERLSQSAAQSDMSFDWPVDDAKLSRGFLLGKRWHYGVDLAAKKGTAILAAESGIVIYAGRGFSGYGKLIVIEHNNKWATLYAHLNTYKVKEGEKVDRGQLIAEMGRTGRASGVHLHFEIRFNRQPVNPLMYLPQGY